MPEIKIADALRRIQSALSASRTVIWTDGTLNCKVVAVDGEHGFSDNWLIVDTELFGRQEIPVGDGFYWWYLDGWNLRDAKDALYIGPSWYLESWPCQENCGFSCKGHCQVKNCAFCT